MSPASDRSNMSDEELAKHWRKPGPGQEKLYSDEELEVMEAYRTGTPTKVEVDFSEVRTVASEISPEDLEEDDKVFMDRLVALQMKIIGSMPD